MIFEKGAFINYRSQKPALVKGGEKSEVFIVGKRVVSIVLTVKGKEESPLIRDVLHISKLANSILFVLSLVEKALTVSFFDSKSVI